MVSLAVVGGLLYVGYAWTQTQYYVGAKGDHVAVYQGIDQKLAWINLSKVHKDRTDIELKYLPSYQRDQVVNTIALSSLGQANDKADELAKQAAVCEKVTKAAKDQTAEAKKKAEDQIPKKSGGSATGPVGGSAATPQKSTPPTPTTPTATPTTAAPPALSLTQDEQNLARNCTSGQP
ncbi:hypothetical protein NYE86_00210 [Actinacidiphila bryophytorum]|nr:hypothetical protein NYE86_00210 [Actinacidiphila bryophytorum]